MTDEEKELYDLYVEILLKQGDYSAASISQYAYELIVNRRSKSKKPTDA